MNPLPFSSALGLVEHIKRSDAWLDLVYRSFRLPRMMFEDMESLSRAGEDDLQPLERFFAESAKERLSAPSGIWSWKKRDSVVCNKSPYLDWLKGQWSAGRWKDDAAILPNARYFLDPRLARFESIGYMSDENNMLGKAWTDIVRSYRDAASQEAHHRSVEELLDASKVSKAGVEAYALQYFEQREWMCRSTASNIGNILTAEKPLHDSEYVFRLSLSFADKKLLDHVEGWISVTTAGTDLRVLNGGETALVAASIVGLLLPASTYYLTHDRDRRRIVQAIAFIDSVVQALTQPI